MYTVEIVLNNGGVIVCKGFATAQEALEFCWAIDTDKFDYNNVQVKKSE